MKHSSYHHSLFSLFLNFFHRRQASSNQSSSDFISSVIHELRTPLNAVFSFSEILQSDIRNPLAAAECIDYIKEINRAAQDMNELICDLLDVDSLKSGNFSVDLSKEIDVAKIIKRSVRLNCGYALKRHIEIKSEVSAAIKPINLDARRLKQILVNLISNAIKYSPENTEIRIEAKQLSMVEGVAPEDPFANFLQIVIVDQGFGMKPEQVACAFEKYQTFENSNSGKVDSFGLGLVITKQLVELQKGRIEIRSKLNKGTEVELKFPYFL
jgi:two-component system cell cycle sensor histidine kinase PleC